MKLEFHPEAEMELIEAAAHYELQVPGLGERFEAEVRRATDILLEHPDIGSPADPHLRRFILNRFPVTLYYSVPSDVLRIKPRAERQIDGAAAWWSENRPAAPGAIREDLKNALEALVEQPGIGTSVENARNQDVRRLYLARVRYFMFYLVINLKTVRALGLTIPPNALLRADRVIE